MECQTKRQFHPHISKQMFLEAHHKLGVSITNDKLWHPMMLNPHIEEQLSQIKSCGDCFS